MSVTDSPSTTEEAQLAASIREALVPLARKLRQQAGPDLTPSMASALATVERLGPITLGDLAAAERVSQPMTTKIAANLVDHGLVTKDVDPSDRRVSRLSLTAAGRKALDRSRSRKNAWLAKRLRRLSPDELERLQAALPVIQHLATDD